MTPETIVEEPVYLPCRDDSLAGVLTIPPHPNGYTALLAWGAGTFPSSSRNRIRTRLARILAEEGFHSLRFDYTGVGESSGDYRNPHLSAPYTDEIVAAASWLVSNGHDRVVAVGNCFGAWSCLMAAPDIPGLAGLAMAGPPVRRRHQESFAANTTRQWWFEKLRGFELKKLLDPDRRARYRSLVVGKASAMVTGSRDSRFADAIEAVVERDLPILLIHWENHFGADVVAEIERGLGEVLDRAPYPTRVVSLQDTVGGRVATQSAVIEATQLWLRDLNTSESRQTASSV